MGRQGKIEAISSKTRLKIAVRELVEHVLRSGDLDYEFLGPSRAVDGIRAHQKIQSARPAEYTCEVPVAHEIETEAFLLNVSGRIDGLYRLPDTVVIEEIKTTTKNLDAFRESQNPVHWGQVKSYAFMYAVQQGMEELDVQLTYYQMETEETLDLRKHFTIGELARFFQDLVGSYLKWAGLVVDWQHMRDESIGKLPFPFDCYRPGQRKMAVDVYRTIKNGGQLIVQAPTGIGKTMAAVFPAVKALGETLTPKIFYLTARTTGRIAAQQALDKLRRRGLRLKSLTLTAKDRICFNPESACMAEECEFARGHFDRVGEALQRIFGQDDFNHETIARAARAFRVCPFEFSLELALWADCIICDYNYAFDPRVYLRRFFLEENTGYTFLIDEAHNLVDRAREMFSAEITKQPFLDLRRTVKNELPQVYRTMGQVNAWLVNARKRCEEAGNFISQARPPDDLYPRLRGFIKATERWLMLNLRTPYREKLLELYFSASVFLRVAERYDHSYATCMASMHKDLRLKLFCLDPSGQLEEALRRCKTAVFFSATMTPTAYFRKILGCAEDAYELMLPSPFPSRNLRVFIADRISTLYHQRQRTRLAVTRAITSLVRQKKGNYLLFFPSYQYLLMICESFADAGAAVDSVVQTAAMSETDKERFLNRFALENPATVVGFAVMGGIFGEGIDLVGDRLSGAVIVGVGLPGISPERELIREYFSDTMKAGFEYAYLYPGINRVLQAAGRVIRSERDRGVVLLIDERFATRRYRSLLPREWQPIRVQAAEQLEVALDTFWKSAVIPSASAANESPAF